MAPRDGMVRAFRYGVLRTNGYVLSAGRDCVVVDPPQEAAAIFSLLGEEGLQVRALLCTHLHFDHVTGCREWQDLTGLPVLAGLEDLEQCDMGFADAAKFGAPPVRPFAVDVLEPGRHGFGGLLCDAIHVPGHSPGHLCYHFPRQNALFSGDTLFYRMLAATDFAPYQSAELLCASIDEKLRPLPPATTVYPGHGKRTTLAGEIAFGTLGQACTPAPAGNGQPGPPA